ncbi:MAG: hypothetical protein RBU37_25365, partial [Myxococcota bacterium]|nr:hypothetical protein [Myxococcota bacterium]
MMLLGVLLLACGNGIVREEGTASDSAADGSDAAALPRLSVGNNLCTTYQEDLLCARFHSRPRKVRRFPITRDILAQSSELTFLFDDGRLITLSNNSDDAPRIKAEGIRYAIRLKDRLLLLNERLQLFDPSTEILDPIEQLLHPNDYTRKPFLPEPVSFAAYFEHLEQLKRVEHSVCALGDGLFGCYALPLGVY